jgi:hypothetical protein
MVECQSLSDFDTGNLDQTGNSLVIFAGNWHGRRFSFLLRRLASRIFDGWLISFGTC